VAFIAFSSSTSIVIKNSLEQFSFIFEIKVKVVAVIANEEIVLNDQKMLDKLTYVRIKWWLGR
jgi:hypothetical protein